MTRHEVDKTVERLSNAVREQYIGRQWTFPQYLRKLYTIKRWERLQYRKVGW